MVATLEKKPAAASFTSEAPVYLRLPWGGFIKALLNNHKRTSLAIESMKRLPLGSEPDVRSLIPDFGQFFFGANEKVKVEFDTKGRPHFYQLSADENGLTTREISITNFPSGGIEEIVMNYTEVNGRGISASRSVVFSFISPSIPGTISDERRTVTYPNATKTESKITFQTGKFGPPMIAAVYKKTMLRSPAKADYDKRLPTDQIVIDESGRSLIGNKEHPEAVGHVMRKLPYDRSIFDLRSESEFLEKNVLAFSPSIESTFWGDIMPSNELTDETSQKRIVFKKGVDYDPSRAAKGDYYFEEVGLMDKDDPPKPLFVLRKKRYMDGRLETQIGIGAYREQMEKPNTDFAATTVFYGEDGRQKKPDFSKGFGNVDDTGIYKYRGHRLLDSLSKVINFNQTVKLFIDQVKNRSFSIPDLKKATRRQLSF